MYYFFWFSLIQEKQLYGNIKICIIYLEIVGKSFLFLFIVIYVLCILVEYFFNIATFHYTNLGCSVFVYTFQLTTVGNGKDQSTCSSTFSFAGSLRFQCLKQHLFNHPSTCTIWCRSKQTEIKVVSKAARIKLSILDNIVMSQSLLFSIKYFCSCWTKLLIILTEFKQLWTPQITYLINCQKLRTIFNR